MSSDPNFPKPRVDVITSVQRRRRWSVTEQVRLVEETMQPSHSVSLVARRAGISPSQLFAWKRRMLEGGAVAVQADGNPPRKRGVFQVEFSRQADPGRFG